MNLMTNFKVGTRLGAGFGLLLLVMCVVTAVGLSRMTLLQGGMERIVEQDYARIGLLNSMREAVRFQSVAMRDVVMQEDIAFKRTELNRMKDARTKYKSAAEQLVKLATRVEHPEFMGRIKQAEDATRAYTEKVVDLSLNDQHKEAADLVRGNLRDSQTQLIARLDDMLKFEETASLRSAEAAKQSYQGAKIFMIVLGALALILGAGISIVITRSIVRPLGRAVRVAERIADGDLTSTIEVEGHDETAALLTALRDMNQNLRRIVGDVKSAADAVASSSGCLSAESTLVMARVEVQTKSVILVSAATEEMTASISDVARGTFAVSEAASSAQDIARDSYQKMSSGMETYQRIVKAVHESGSAIGELSDAVAKISVVTRVIKDIAEQTNLLALNAAIEAARAGEQGRGFAVVADEVRKLAEGTAASTEHITEMAASVKNKAATAVRSMELARNEAQNVETFSQASQASLQHILEAATKVAGLSEQIEHATREQTKASAETARNMEEISVISEENTASINQVGNNARTLADTAVELQRLVGQFRLARDVRR
jgi:methyl-accepting chemotaxis protein